MRISWGVKISVLYGGFVLLIVCMVTMAMRQKVDLVSKDYYEQELKFQGKIDKINRTHSLKEPLTWQVKQDGMMLKFPKVFNGNTITGNLYFFRPSDAAMDKTILLKADTSTVRIIALKHLKKGVYKMEINWETGGEQYYNEGIIHIH